MRWNNYLERESGAFGSDPASDLWPYSGLRQPSCVPLWSASPLLLQAYRTHFDAGFAQHAGGPLDSSGGCNVANPRRLAPLTPAGAEPNYSVVPKVLQNKCLG